MDDDFIDPTLNPAKSNAAIAALLQDQEQQKDRPPAPDIPSLPDTLFQLPGGYLTFEGTILRDVEVRELTGKDEEKIAKAKNTGDVGRWLNTILLCGTVSIGGEKVTQEILNDLLIGDRDFLLNAIRSATYGPEVELGEWICPDCSETFEATYDLRKLPRHDLTGDRFFRVPLRRGGEAGVHLPMGSDQIAFLNLKDATDSERNSLLLRRVVDTLPQDGEDVPVVGFESQVDNLGLLDRKRILSEIEKRMPGPRYDEATITHECGREFPAPLGLVSLFPDL